MLPLPPGVPLRGKGGFPSWDLPNGLGTKSQGTAKHQLQVRARIDGIPKDQHGDFGSINGKGGSWGWEGGGLGGWKGSATLT